MSDSLVLQKSFLWRVVQFASSFAINIVLVNLLGASLAGEFYYLIYFLSFFVSFFSLGLDISINVFLTKKQITAQQALSLGLMLLLPALLASIGVIYWYGDRFVAPSFSLPFLLLLSSVFIFGSLTNVFLNAILTSFNRNHIISRTTLVFNIVLLCIYLFLSSFYAEANLLKIMATFYFTFILLQSVANLIYCSRFVSSLKRFELPRLSVIKRLLLFSGLSFITNLSFALVPYLILTYVRVNYSGTSLGNFVQAFKIVELIGVLCSSAYYAVITVVSRKEDFIVASLLRFIRIINLSVFLFCTCFLIFGRSVIPVVFGNTFSDLYTIFLYFMPGMFAVCASSFCTAFFYGVGKVHINFRSSLAQLFVFAVAFLFLFKHANIKGIALAYSACMLISFLYDLVMIKKIYHYPVSALLLPTRDDLTFIGNTFRQATGTKAH